MYKKEIFLLESVSTGKTHLVKYLNEKELKEMKIYRTEYKQLQRQKPSKNIGKYTQLKLKKDIKKSEKEIVQQSGEGDKFLTKM